jgi:hypothetical protein
MAVEYTIGYHQAINDLKFPPAGAAGHVALIDDFLATNIVFTASTATNEITTAAVQNLRTGSRIRLTTAGTLPAPLVAGTDYFIIKAAAAATPSAVFRLATSLANAQSATAIVLTTTGSGTQQLTEQALNKTDPLSVWVAHEFPNHVGYASRFTATSLGACLLDLVLNEAYKVATFSYLNGAATLRVIKHILFIRSGSSTIADSTGTFLIETPTTPVQCPQGTPRAYSIRLSDKG